MSSYFDEHNCDPLPERSDSQDGGAAGDLIEFARFLILTGNWNNSEFATLFQDRPPPATSKEFIDNLERRVVREPDDRSCPICLKKYDQDEEMTALPCKHEFHFDCVIPWLQKTSSCPMCRFELPTQDPEWEEMRRQKKREVEREKDLELLHDSMFG